MEALPATRSRKNVLPVIVLSQFAGTSLWFVGNAVLPELKQTLHLSQYAVSQVTAAIMIGFIAGTLVFGIFSLADRYSPVKLFFSCSILAAFANSSVAWFAGEGTVLLALRFVTGFFLAGIYPVGMKIAADWFEQGLGKALGYLVGALVLGTAFPHLLKNRDFDIPWRTVLHITSLFAVLGGFLMLILVGDGPHRREAGRFNIKAVSIIFTSPNWRKAAFGYFGHMWELYAFWGFTPLVLSLYAEKHQTDLNVPLLSFLIIGAGSIGCVAGGYLSATWGSARVAFITLFISGCCCLLSPLFYQLPFFIFITLLMIWGLTAAADSPQFSTLVAQYAPAELRGTALTIYNSIGFAITTVSLFVIDRVFYSNFFLAEEKALLVLGLGALFGLPGILRLTRQKK